AVDDDGPDGHIAVVRRRCRFGQSHFHGGNVVHAGPMYERREWDSNPRWVAPHTLSRRADSSALASLRGASCEGSRVADGPCVSWRDGLGTRWPKERNSLR